MSGQTVFVQFRYCLLCRLNHKKGKKHVHSKRHQDIVAGVLKKFFKKISEASEFLKKPSVKDVTWDRADHKFWCYFCHEDVVKHRLFTSISGNCILECGGMLEHLTRTDHVENTAKFLKENKLDMKRTPEFIISSKVYLQYLEYVESACSQFFMQKSQALSQIASQIKIQTEARQSIVACSLREQSLHWQDKKQQQPLAEGILRSKLGKDFLGVEERGKKTVQAFGEGLTAIERPDEDDSAGNIYTNALPPWMQTDQDTEAPSGIIGPTMVDLEKHKKLERKRQLPACRVGAKFDRKSDQTDSWLPDFGGVWNHGRRTNSVNQFKRRQYRKGILVSPFSPTEQVSHQGAPPSPQTSSYCFPKLLNRTSTITSNSEAVTGFQDDSTQQHLSAQRDLPLSSDSISLSPTSISQKSELGNDQGFKAFGSESFYSKTVTKYLNSSSVVASMDSFVTVKPYVRKLKGTPSPNLDTGLSPASFYPSQSALSHPGKMDTTNTGSSMFGIHGLYSCEKLPSSFQPFKDFGSGVDHQGESNLNGMAHTFQGYTKHRVNAIDGKVLNPKNNIIPLRLIATPVLDQQKNKFPLKKSL